MVSKKIIRNENLGGKRMTQYERMVKGLIMIRQILRL